jgi:hypothetical protein
VRRPVVASITEVEIREAIFARAAGSFSGDPTPGPGESRLHAALRGVVDDYADPVLEPARAALADVENYGRASVGLWHDLRRSEAEDLYDLAEQAIARAADRAEAVILDELIGAGVRFAELHPDAPRRRPRR